MSPGLYGGIAAPAAYGHGLGMSLNLHRIYQKVEAFQANKRQIKFLRVLLATHLFRLINNETVGIFVSGYGVSKVVSPGVYGGIAAPAVYGHNLGKFIKHSL